MIKRKIITYTYEEEQRFTWYQTDDMERVLGRGINYDSLEKFLLDKINEWHTNERIISIDRSRPYRMSILYQDEGK